LRRLFIDTSAWIARSFTDELHHEAVAASFRMAAADYGALVTTDMVLAETQILLRVSWSVLKVNQWWRRLLASPRLELRFTDRRRWDQAWELL
jgi:predicted nucleic acid-binding protein